MMDYKINTPILWECLKGARRRDSVESLCIDLAAGNSDAGRMLHKLLYWWERSKSGVVYKSWRDWWLELRIKQSSLPGAKAALEYAGVEITLKKANGAPTLHFSLDVQRFMRRLAQTLGLRLWKLILFFQNPVNGFWDSEKMDLSESAKSITTESPTIKTTKKRVLADETPVSGENGLGGSTETPAFAQERNDDAPLPHKLAEWLPQYGREMVRKYGYERVRLVCHHANGANSPAGYIRKALAEGWALDVPQIWYDETWQHFASGTVESPPAVAPAPQQETTSPAVQGDAATQWETTYQQLGLQLDRDNFDMCLRGATLAGVEGDTFVVMVRDGYARDMLQRRLYRNVRRLLCDVRGCPSELRFEVRSELVGA